MIYFSDCHHCNVSAHSWSVLLSYWSALLIVIIKVLIGYGRFYCSHNDYSVQFAGFNKAELFKNSTLTAACQNLTQ